MWFVYLLLCADGSFYTGVSNDVEKRLLDHQKGRGGRYTRSHKAVKVIYKEQYNSQQEALKREYEIKSWSRKKKIAVLRLI